MYFLGNLEHSFGLEHISESDLLIVKGELRAGSLIMQKKKKKKKGLAREALMAIKQICFLKPFIYLLCSQERGVRN
jgi:hypothetical protein